MQELSGLNIFLLCRSPWVRDVGIYRPIQSSITTRCPSEVGLPSFKHFHFLSVNKTCNFSCSLFNHSSAQLPLSPLHIKSKGNHQMGLFVSRLIDAVICPTDLQGLSVVFVPLAYRLCQKPSSSFFCQRTFPLPFLPLTSFFSFFLLYALVVFQVLEYLVQFLGIHSGELIPCVQIWFGGIRFFLCDVPGLWKW